MNIFNVVFKHVAKNFEISVGITVKKIKLANKGKTTALKIHEMNIFNIVFRHVTKNFEICVGITIKKLKLANKEQTTVLEIVQN